MQSLNTGLFVRAVPAPAARQVNVHVHEAGYQVAPATVDARGPVRHVERSTRYGLDAVALDQDERARHGRPPGAIDQRDVLDEEALGRGVLRAYDHQAEQDR